MTEILRFIKDSLVTSFFIGKELVTNKCEINNSYNQDWNTYLGIIEESKLKTDSFHT